MKTTKQARIEEAKERRHQANKASGRPDFDGLYVFSSPLRTNILTSLNEEGEGSAQDLGERLGATTGTVDYHLKVLVVYGFAELVRTERKGNRGKHVHRAIRRAELSVEEWEQLPVAAKSSWMHLSFRTMLHQAERGLLIGSFERWPESPVLSDAIWVDLEAFHKINTVLEDAWEKSLDIAADAGACLSEVEENGGEVLKLGLHVASFPVQLRQAKP